MENINLGLENRQKDENIDSDSRNITREAAEKSLCNTKK